MTPCWWCSTFCGNNNLSLVFSVKRKIRLHPAACNPSISSKVIRNISYTLSVEYKWNALIQNNIYRCVITTQSQVRLEWILNEKKRKQSIMGQEQDISTDFLGDTDSSSMVDSSSPSKPNRSLLCFCKIRTSRKTSEWINGKTMEYLLDDLELFIPKNHNVFVWTVPLILMCCRASDLLS